MAWIRKIGLLLLIKLCGFAFQHTLLASVHCAGAGEVRTTGERVCLYYSNGMERVVVETAFTGNGSNFAWVLAFPSVPEIQPVHQFFFPALKNSFQPELVDGEGHGYGLLVVLILGPVIVSMGYKRWSQSSTWTVVLLLAFQYVLEILLIHPTGLRTGSGQMDRVRDFHKGMQGQVEITETLIHSNRDGRTLFEWMNTNGWVVTKETATTIRQMSRDGWCFVTMKLDGLNCHSNPAWVHPMAFTFKATHPVLPMKIEGADRSSGGTELFVFGPSRAEIDGFRVQYCGLARYDTNHLRGSSGSFDQKAISGPVSCRFRFANPEVKQCIENARVATMLVQDLKFRQADGNDQIRWRAFREEIPPVYSPRAVFFMALDWTLPIGLMGMIVILFIDPLHRVRRFLYACTILWLVAGIVGCAQVLSCQQSKMMHVLSWNKRQSALKHLDVAIWKYNEDRKDNAFTTNGLIEAVNSDSNHPVVNVFTGKPVRYAGTPGDILFREATNGMEVLWHDRDYVPHVMYLFER